MFSSRTASWWLLAGLIGLMSVLTWLLGEVGLGRIYRLGLGVLAALFIGMAAVLWLRTARQRWLKALPMRWLQKNHILIGSLSAPLTVCHLGGLRSPGSLFSWALIICYLLVVFSGVTARLFKTLRATAIYVEQNIKSKSATTADLPALSQKQQDALAGSQTIVETQDQHLEGHRALTLALLVLLMGHILFHLYY
jgi:hypothetical protein